MIKKSAPRGNYNFPLPAGKIAVPSKAAFRGVWPE